MQHTLLWQNDKLRTDAAPAALRAARTEPGALFWIDIAEDVNASMNMLATTCALSRITLDSVRDQQERAKLVQGKEYFHLVAHGMTFDTAAQTAVTPKLDIIFGANFLVTVHEAEMPWLKRLWDAVRTGKTDENEMQRGAAYLLYAVMDALVDSYFPVLDDLDDMIDDLENVTVRDTSNEVQARIFRMKRSLAQMRRVISPQVEVANALITRTGETIPREAEPLFADVHDHLVRVFEVLDSYRDLMSGLLDVYLTTVSNRLNAVMKQLTIIATIFMPITFITGVFGQNFGHLPQVEHDNGSAFFVVLAAMALITVAQIWYFKRKDWL
ncbi:MAG TPA: magnesium/cobalt transporter CorA [Ktedonobacterales bacterium]|nr:magnesium/cobalt transporter CorA [Ktedonobacterales bacterium]